MDNRWKFEASLSHETIRNLPESEKDLVATALAGMEKGFLGAGAKRTQSGFQALLDRYFEQLKPLKLHEKNGPNGSFIADFLSHLAGVKNLADFDGAAVGPNRTNRKESKQVFRQLETFEKEAKKSILMLRKSAGSPSSSLGKYLTGYDSKTAMADAIEGVLKAHFSAMHSATEYCSGRGVRRGPKQKCFFQGLIWPWAKALSIHIGKSPAYDVAPFADRLFEGEQGIRAAQKASGLKLMANGLYLGGLGLAVCKEAHLRKQIEAMKRTFGSDWEGIEAGFFPENTEEISKS